MPVGVGAVGISNAGGFGSATANRPSRYLVSGLTLDANGSPLGGCTVDVFESVGKLFRGSTVSDANGNWAVEIVGDRTITLRADAYLAGATDVAGTTVNTLTAS